MASPQPDRSFNELRWVTRIRRTLGEELDDEPDLPVSIFNVPKALQSSNPEAYTPQEVAIGPYHHWRPELHEMERYKLAAARRVQRNHPLGDVKFQDLVEQLTKLESRVRACYHRYLDLNGETLGWMMAIDASFLLEILQVFAINEGKALRRVSSRMSHLVDYAGRKSAHNAILRDIMMLENQIPIFILQKTLEFQLRPSEESDNVLHAMLMGLCKELNPFKTMEELPEVDVSESVHLLDILYRIIVPRSDQRLEIISEDDQDEAEPRDARDENPSLRSKIVESGKQLVEEIGNLPSKLNRSGPIRFLKERRFSKTLKVALRLPWAFISNLPGISVLKHPIEFLFFAESKEDERPDNGNPNGLPSVEEIAIPSVSELSKSGVCFVPTSGDLSSISFDPKAVAFYLPVISLDINSEVTMRNLVAYEASIASGPLVFTRYTELMNGIIDTEEDAKYLRERGIILNYLKSDQEVADLWNGMSKSIRLTKVPFLDKTIEDLNKYVLTAVMLLLLLTLQAFCSLYRCARASHT